MKISIITVCKNSEKYIEKAIKSVVNQTYKNYEYIIVDGKSEDQTCQIVAKYSDYVAKFISETDNGLYEAMNKGIRLATGDFIYFLNSDDYFFDQEVLKDVVQTLLGDNTCDFLYGNVEQVSISGECFPSKLVKPEYLKIEMIISCAIPHQGSFFKADLFEKLGYFDETYRIAADYEWFTRLLQDQSVKLTFIDRTIATYYCGGLSGKNLGLAYQEMFDAQNKSGLFNNEESEIRINKFQEFCIEQQVLIRKLQSLADQRLRYAQESQNHLDTALSLANQRLAFIEASGFGKLINLAKKAIKTLKS
jgi:glycosyltransferase involved in cell wall biosynthesis